MLKKFLFFVFIALAFNACASKNTYTQVNQISNSTKCSPCESANGFEAKIKGLLYVSDVGIKCCANKRTLDTSVALKKVYLHRFNDLSEEQKVLKSQNQRLFIDLKFNAVFYTYLTQELKARGIIVLDKNEANSPYVSKIDLNFISFSSNYDTLGLHSKIAGTLQISDINKNKSFTIRTKQDVQGFSDLKETNFYTHLLLKQMANKAASLISEL